MGCGTSKGTIVVATTMDPQSNKMKKAPGKMSKKTSTNVVVVPEKIKTDTKKSSGLENDTKSDSCESLLNTNKSIALSSRQSSAKSKDSGLGVDTESDHISADKSSPNKVNSKLEHRKRNTIKLPPLKPKTRAPEDVELEAILQKRVKFADALINELPATNSIVKRPVSRGGVAFDIRTDGEDDIISKAQPEEELVPRKPVPLCVRNYAKRQRRANTVTKYELEKKQKAAEQRRKVSVLCLNL